MISTTIHLSISDLLSSATLIVLAGLAVYVLARAAYELFFSQLSTIPGPWHAAFSELWLTSHVLRLQQCQTVHSLFEKYGPVVRVGPNKVVFRDAPTLRSVYAVNRFDKSTYYKSLLTNDNNHAMTTLEHADHVNRRKSYAPHYTHANLCLFQSELADATTELLNVIETAGSQQPLETLSMFRHFMVDIIVSSSHGYRHGALAKWASGIFDELSTAVADFPKRGIVRSAVPTWAWSLVCKIPHARLRLLCQSDKIMAEFMSARVYELRAQMNAGVNTEREKIPLLERLLSAKPGASAMTDLDAISEIMGHFIAGSDTTSISLGYFFWEISQRPDISHALQLELDAVMPDSRTLLDADSLNKLPYLNAFIKEGLRVYGAVPSLLERVVPASNSKTGAPAEAFDMMGFALPPGTVVATQAWSMHRDAQVFPSPDTFMPSRWLDANPQQLATMMQSLMPFGYGSRVCGGQALALMALKLTVASIMRNFNVTAPAETTEKTMAIKDSFVIFPASMECKLSFQSRK